MPIDPTFGQIFADLGLTFVAVLGKNLEVSVIRKQVSAVCTVG